MYKLLLGLGIIDLAFHFPQLTALTLVGAFLYQNLTEQDKQQLMSIYSNGKEFTKYLSNKAKELGLSLKDFRKQIVNNVESPPPPDYTEVFDDDDDDINDPEMKVPLVGDDFSRKLEEYIGDNLVNELKTNHALFEYVASQLASFIPQYLANEINPTKKWIEDISLTDFFYHLGVFAEPPEELLHNYYLDRRDKLIELNVDFNAPYTYKIHRGIKKKLKAQGKNALNEVIDPDLVEFIDSFIEALEDFFRGEYSDPLRTKATRISESDSRNYDVNLIPRVEETEWPEE